MQMNAVRKSSGCRFARCRSGPRLLAVSVLVAVVSAWSLACSEAPSSAETPIPEPTARGGLSVAERDECAESPIDALRLVAQTDVTEATRRGRELLADATDQKTTRDVLAILLDVDPAFAIDDLLQRARNEAWAQREEVLAWYAPLLVRIDRAEARMMVRASLQFSALDPDRHTEFVTALSRPDAAAARRGLAPAFVEEADRFDNAINDGRARHGVQAFYLRCHLASGGTVADFAGWLPRVLQADAHDRRGHEELIRTLEAALDVNVLRTAQPSAAELDAAAAKLLDVLPR